MARLPKLNVFTTPKPRTETPTYKTTRAVSEIIDGDAENREIKTARLRKARLVREASPAVEVVAPSTSKARNKPPVKAIR